MGKKPKKQKIQPIPRAIPVVTPEDEDIQGVGEDERRRLAALKGRKQTVTSQRGVKSSILG